MWAFVSRSAIYELRITFVNILKIQLNGNLKTSKMQRSAEFSPCKLYGSMKDEVQSCICNLRACNYLHCSHLCPLYDHTLLNSRSLIIHTSKKIQAGISNRICRKNNINVDLFWKDSVYRTGILKRYWQKNWAHLICTGKNINLKGRHFL